MERARSLQVCLANQTVQQGGRVAAGGRSSRWLCAAAPDYRTMQPLLGQQCRCILIPELIGMSFLGKTSSYLKAHVVQSPMALSKAANGNASPFDYFLRIIVLASREVEAIPPHHLCFITPVAKLSLLLAVVGRVLCSTVADATVGLALNLQLTCQLTGDPLRGEDGLRYSIQCSTLSLSHFHCNSYSQRPTAPRRNHPPL